MSNQQTPQWGQETPERVIGRVLVRYADALMGASPAVVATVLAGSVGNALDGLPSEQVEAFALEAAEKLWKRFDARTLNDQGHAQNLIRRVFIDAVRGAERTAPSQRVNGAPSRWGDDGPCKACGGERGRHDVDCPIRAEKMERLADTIHLRRAVREMNQLRPANNPLREKWVAAIEAWRNNVANGTRHPKPLWAFQQYESPEAYVRARHIQCGLEPLPELPQELRDAPPPPDPYDLTDPTDDFRDGDPESLGAVVLGIDPDAIGVAPQTEDEPAGGAP